MKRALSNPLEPQAGPFLKRPASHSPFMIVPFEIMDQIVPLFSRNDLFHFEQACCSHSTLTDKAWEALREEDFLNHLNWQACQGSHRSHYLLSKVIISYVKTLPFFEFSLSEEQRNKFVPMREKFPPFNAFVQLTELPQEQKEIPEALAIQLKEEASFQLITDLYQFARKYWRLKRQLRSQSQCEVFRKQFEEGLKIQIKTAIGQGTTCLSEIGTHFFRRFSLLNNSDGFNSVVIEWALEAFKKGDLSGFCEMRKMEYEDLRSGKRNWRISLSKHASEQVKEEEKDFSMFDSIEKFLGGLEAAGFEIKPTPYHSSHLPHHVVNLNNFASHYPMNVELTQRLWERVSKSLNNVHMPLEQLRSLFKSHVHDRRWKEADECLEHILKKNNQLSLFFLLAAAKVKAHLKQWDKADTFYKALSDKWEKQSSDQESFDHKIKTLLMMETLEVKMQLQDFQGANVYAEQLFSQKQKQTDVVSTHTIQCCMRLKESIQDPVGAVWFKSLYHLAVAILKNQQSCEAVNSLLDSSFYQSKRYRVPRLFLLKIGNLKFQLAKWTEAEFFYDRYIQFYTKDKMDVTSKINYAITKFRLGKWQETIEMCQLALTQHPEEIQENAYLYLMSAHSYLEQWDKVILVGSEIVNLYGDQTPAWIWEKMVFAEDKLEKQKI